MLQSKKCAVKRDQGSSGCSACQRLPLFVTGSDYQTLEAALLDAAALLLVRSDLLCAQNSTCVYLVDV